MQKLFEKNIQFFYHSIPEYYNLIKNIKTRNYKISQDNIIDIKTNQKIYLNSIEQDSLEIAFQPTHNNLWNKKFFAINPDYFDEEKFPHTGKAINNLIDNAKKYDSYGSKSFYFDTNFLPSTAIFGLLAGKHLDLLVKKYDFHSLFVYEPNPEFFGISLYFVDYSYIFNKLQNRFFLWVNGKIDYYALEKFFYERIVTSSFLTLTYETYSNPLIEDAKIKFEQIRLAKFRGWGTYEDEMKGVNNHIQNINKYPTFTKAKKLNVPICVIANGKSLEKSIDFIKNNIDSMILVSVGTSIQPLLNAGIESDFHIEQERIDLLPEILKEPLSKYNGYFLGASVVNPKVFSYAKKPLMFVREGFTFEIENALIGSSPLVGNSGFAFAAMYSNEIYLCGMDLGFRLNERKHSKNSFYDNRNDIEISGIKIKGNFSDDIYTDSLFLTSKIKIENLIKAMNLKVYNLSDGVYINNTIPLKDKSLPKINKEKYIQEIVSTFINLKLSVPSINLHSTLKKIEKSFKITDINNIKDLTGVIDFIEDVLKSANTPDIIIIKGSIYHYLLHLYILAHKIERNKIKDLIKKIKLTDFFPESI